MSQQKKLNNKIPYHRIERESEYSALIYNSIPIIKKSQLYVERNFTVGGDAPKELVHIYIYHKNNNYRKKNIKRWPFYIAKTGHKWYPSESITEKLLNDLGICFGLRMAESEMKVIEKIKMLWHDSDETNINAIQGDSGRFDLYINNLLVGILTYSNSEWSFCYSNEFKSQKDYVPLSNFPSINTTYTSKHLWPFFTSRLPGSHQLKDANEESKDVLSLLKKHATHVISNPYILIPIQ